MDTPGPVVFAGCLFFVTMVVFVVVASRSRHFEFLYWRLQFRPRLKFVKSHKTDQIHAAYTPKKFQGPVFFIICLLSMSAAYKMASYLFLCYLYGFARVRSEALILVQTHKGRPWIVSNGDQIPANVQGLHFVIVVVIWLLMTITGYALIQRFLPNRRDENTV